ncbi:MAG: O-antigen ligase family protein, partial [Pseudomonadota bacterium]|nr:O-antigen ligase family protein [Pseudomonadota bacterium]
AAIACRKYLAWSRLIRWAVWGSLVIIPVFAVIGAQYVTNLLNRTIGQARSGDIGEASSGRTDLWFDAFRRMFDHPLSLLTGFGWHGYESMNLEAEVPHNHYIWLWFNLGLVGLFSFLVIVWQTLSEAKVAAARADPDSRRYMMAVTFGLTGTAVAIFFTNLFTPWPYIWMYLGLSLRTALLVRSATPGPATAAVKPEKREPLKTAVARRKPVT